MRAVPLLVVSCLLLSCGGPSQRRTIKTPDEIIAEQEAIAIEEERLRAGKEETYSDDDLADEEQAPFDARHAKIELTRAARSAADCPSVVTEQVSVPQVVVRIKFGNDGKVLSGATEISGVGSESALARCVLNAMEAVVVPKFGGSPVTVDWKVPFDDGNAGAASAR